MTQKANITADLYVTCVIDQLYPEVGVSVVNVPATPRAKGQADESVS